MTILNLSNTQIPDTSSLDQANAKQWASLNTFVHVPSQSEADVRKESVVNFLNKAIEGHDAVVVSGASYFTSTIEATIKAAGKKALYSHLVMGEVKCRKRGDGEPSTKLAPVHGGFVEV